MTDETNSFIMHFPALPAAERAMVLEFMTATHLAVLKAIPKDTPKQRGRPPGSKTRKAKAQPASTAQV